MTTATTVFVVTEKTTKLLKNFASIQSSVLLQPGKKQTTVSTGKSVFAVVELPDEWPEETGIYDLNTFLGALSLDSKSTVMFDKSTLLISDGRHTSRYRKSDPSTILTAPADEPGNKLKTDLPGVLFSLSADDLSKMKKACAVLGLMSPTGLVTITVEDGVVSVRCLDEKNPSAHTWEFEVPAKDVTITGSTAFTKEISFKTEYLTMLFDGGYNINLSDKKYGHFKHHTEPVQYFVVGKS